MGCKFSGRTAALVVVVLQICVLYCVLWEAFVAIAHGDRSLVAGQPDFSLFLYLFAAVEVLAMVGGAGIIVAAAGKTLPFRKSFVILMLGFNFCLVLPLNASGMHLYLSAKPTVTGLDNATQAYFSDFVSAPNGTTMSAGLASIQTDYCCCGLDSHEDYGNHSANTTAFCPTKKKCPSREGELPGCRMKIPRKLRTLVLVCSCLGGFCSLVAIGVSPFVYAFFEKDRRAARADVIRQWQKSVERMMDAKQRQLSREVERPSSSRSGEEEEGKSGKKSDKSGEK